MTEAPSPINGSSTDPRLASLLETLQSFAMFDFSRSAEIGPSGDDIDALAAGINMLGEEVAAAQKVLQERSEQLARSTVELETEVVERRRAESALRDAHDRLERRLTDLERINREIAQLTEMTNMFQVCKTRQEAFQLLGRVGPALFDGSKGSVFTFAPSRDVVAVVVSWGGVEAPRAIEPADCWGLRRGRVHASSRDQGLRCPHIPTDSTGSHLCVPLIAQGEVLGLLYLSWPEDDDDRLDELDHSGPLDTRARLAAAAAEQMALALANLDLRAALQSQSIRDPLTNLYNRRYLDETLTRELHRADREVKPVSVLMIDVDRFKGFNDAYGHDAGDLVLRELSVILRKGVRVEDVVCRYGGEEFAIVMAGADTAEAVSRAEILRSAISHADFDWHGQPFETITASFGVATYPDHADTKAELIGVADRALYLAKDRGRDRVVAFEPEVGAGLPDA